MHITIDTASQFRNEFHRAGRATQFSYDGLGLLFEYLEEVSPDLDLDVIALCCEYREATPAEIARDYSIDLNDADDEQCLQIVTQHLNAEGAYIGTTDAGTIVYSSF
jgi:histidyl-tRNA synthetase